MQALSTSAAFTGFGLFLGSNEIVRQKHFAQNHRFCTPPCAPQDPIIHYTGSPEGIRIFTPVARYYLCSLLIMTTHYLVLMANSYSSFIVH